MLVYCVRAHISSRVICLFYSLFLIGMLPTCVRLSFLHLYLTLSLFFSRPPTLSHPHTLSGCVQLLWNIRGKVGHY